MLLIQLVVYRLIALLIVSLKFYFGSNKLGLKEKIVDKWKKLRFRKIERSDTFHVLESPTTEMSTNLSAANVKINLDYLNGEFDERNMVTRNVLENVLD